MRKDMRRVSLGNFNSYKDVTKNPLMLQKLERVNDFIHLHSDVYVSYGISCKKSNELLNKLANRKRLSKLRTSV